MFSSSLTFSQMSTSTATSDMTPPRSPSIPEPLLDDLLELWCETADYNGEEDCVDIRGALSELGFDTSSLNSSNGNESRNYLGGHDAVLSDVVTHGALLIFTIR